MLAREHRLRSGDEIREVIKSGKRISNSFATLHYVPSSEPKFAVVASRALGNAVMRNLVRRRTKAAIYSLLSEAPSVAAVVRLKANRQVPSFLEISSSMSDLFRRIK